MENIIDSAAYLAFIIVYKVSNLKNLNHFMYNSCGKKTRQFKLHSYLREEI